MVLCLPDSWSNWNLEMLVFEERGKPEQRRELITTSTHILASIPALTTSPPLIPPSCLQPRDKAAMLDVKKIEFF